MSELARIENQLRLAFEGEAWHGPSLRELLADLSPGDAAARPVPSAHSIWEMVGHVVVWEDVVRRRLGGEKLEGLSAAEDWPAPAEATAENWDALRGKLAEGNQRLREAIRNLEEGRLNQPVPGRADSVYEMLHGLIHHDLYHAGQIAVVKKALRQES